MVSLDLYTTLATKAIAAMFVCTSKVHQEVKKTEMVHIYHHHHNFEQRVFSEVHMFHSLGEGK